MKAMNLRRDGWMFLIGAVLVGLAWAGVAKCQKFEKSAEADRQLIQMVDQVMQAQAVAHALQQIENGEIEAGTLSLEVKLAEHVSAIKELAFAGEGELAPMAVNSFRRLAQAGPLTLERRAALRTQTIAHMPVP